jgi:organic hydroperoxide reductase OsmC/OhrA
VRQIPAGPDRIAEIRVSYRIRVPAGKREAAERAVATHEQKCPAATSVRGCIPIRISADIVED